MDPDVFPNSLEYWGPTGMVFFRNVQVRWMRTRENKSFTLALERPGASGDGGVYASRVELQNIKARFPIPDFSGAFKFKQDWGYFRVAGIVGRISWDDVLVDQFDLSGYAYPLRPEPELERQSHVEETRFASSWRLAKASRTT